MKTKNLRSILFSVVLLIIVACQPKIEISKLSSIDKEQIKKEIQAKENLFAETYNEGKMKKIGYYADDAVSFSQNRPALVGKQAIVEFLADGINSFASTHKISFITEEVFPSNDGIQVVEIGYYKVVDSLDVVVNSGNYMSLFKKRNGRYVSVRDMSTSDLPLE